MTLNEPSYPGTVMIGAFGVLPGGQRRSYPVIELLDAPWAAINCRAVGYIRRFGNSAESYTMLKRLDVQDDIVEDVYGSTSQLWAYIARTDHRRVDTAAAAVR